MKTAYDVVVIGGGIVGAAVAQHLTAAGYRTLLAEARDYGSGTTSRTSRLQHCGLGYLSPASRSLGAFLRRPGLALACLGLLRRSMQGRAEFVTTSPERVRAVEFLVPLTAEQSISAWKARLAFRIMQSCDGGKVPLDMRLLSAAEAAAHPALQGLYVAPQGAIAFTEYQYVWPERIVIDTIMKARRIGLEALNYAPVTGIAQKADFWWLSLGGESPRKVTTRAVVNCAGVFVDDITALTGVSDLRLNVRAKGANIAIRLPDRFHGVGIETLTSTGAPFYLIPWGDLHYVGPWDSPATNSSADFRTNEGEVEAILRELGRLFPDLALTRDQVLYSWAGPRPRTADPATGDAGPDVTEHDLSARGLPNFFVCTGGLLMMHRDTARRVTRMVKQRIAPTAPARQLDPSTCNVPDGNQVSETSVRYAIVEEQARSLTGILRRRLPVGWDADLGLGHAEGAAKIAGELLGWSDAERRAQLDRFRQQTERDFGLLT